VLGALIAAGLLLALQDDGAAEEAPVSIEPAR
jgi:hypothetical protein